MKYASLFLIAHLLAQPWGTRVPNTTPALCFESVIRKLADLLAFHGASLNWPDALLCKIIRALRAAIHIDDGQASSSKWKLCWKNFVDGRSSSYDSEEQGAFKWAQRKYNHLGVTRAAVVLVGHPNLYIQLEALQLLVSLLQGGNPDVQDTLYTILASGGTESILFFSSLKMAIQRYVQFEVLR